MSTAFHRRKFLTSVMGIPAAGMLMGANAKDEYTKKIIAKGLKTSLNAYSFNKSLTDGSMSIDELIGFCSATGFDGVDITAYYFKGYPEIPPDDYLFDIKRKAFKAGLEITGTGVRNDFTIADKAKREGEVQLVKNWIEAASKMGAAVLRIFSGTQKNEGIPREQVTEWMLRDIQTCVDHGKQHGVIIGMQNHNDFIQTADQIISIVETINSPWFGIILDIGSYRINEPFAEIEKSIRHAVNWQVKEKMFINGRETDTDLNKLINMIKASGYRGYLPIETLGEGDPKIKVKALFEKIQKALQ
ncbi:MAG TPA: sugar phosphate isomerase/epimerase family protein [Chitinophagaceae bacterium]|nr:sugar phosphate isomerase/epimerase family protein [Chitinophagaceae bacterium]